MHKMTYYGVIMMNAVRMMVVVNPHSVRITFFELHHS